jgi:D-3-phosphoglycerate dehydrogenase
MLALARAIPAADRAMKEGRWEKKAFLGTELRGKTLGVAGFGRIGQEVAPRARAFGMHVIAHDPFISADLAGRFGVELVSIDELCAASDYLTLHLPATADTHHLFNDERFARCKPGVRLINTARGELVDEQALGRAIEKGIVAGAGLDVFENEPLTDWGLARRPQVIATPHIAASTEEAQEMVGHETAVTVRNFLRDGVVRNAVNFPSVHPEELQRLQPWIRLVDLLGAMASQMGVARIEAISLRYRYRRGHATDCGVERRRRRPRPVCRRESPSVRAARPARHRHRRSRARGAVLRPVSLKVMTSESAGRPSSADSPRWMRHGARWKRPCRDHPDVPTDQPA